MRKDTVARAARQQSTTRAARGEETRAALLRSASHTICELGMQGASIDLIAERAGYTKGAFYAHFASKEQLLLVMLEQKFATDLERLSAGVTGTADAVEEARQVSEEFLYRIERDPEWPRLYQEFATYAARNERFRRQFAARQRDLRAGIAEVFSRWAASFGIDPPLAPSDIAAMTFFMTDGFLIDRIVDPELDSALYATMGEVFLRGLLAMAQDPGRDT